YYSHIPQIIIVSSYNLLIKPLLSLFSLPFTLYAYYNWTKYLLLCFFPIPVFLALRLVGFSTVLAALSAFFASHLSTDGLYGIDPPSFLWRGYGLTSQLYAMIFMPLALAFMYRAMRKITPSYSQSDLFLASLFLCLTTAGHLGMGIITFISTVPFVFLDLDKTHLTERLKKAVMIYIFALLPLVYWIIPMLLKLNYHIVSFWDPIWKFNSYGWYEVVQQFLQGEIFDWQRLPIITVLVVIGFFALLLNTRLFPFALLFAFWFLMYFGRTTWGNLLDLIPGMKDFHQHRFIVGIHIAALFLIPAGLEYLLQLLNKIITFVKHGKIFVDRILSERSRVSWREEHVVSSELRIKKILSANESTSEKLIFYVFSIILISIFIYFTAKQTNNYASFNNRWIGEANIAYQYDQKNFQDLVVFLKSQPNGRIYAGRPGNWGKQLKLGSTQLYMLLGIHDYDMSQFLPETWSMLSENEQDFDERVAEDYNLLNIRYIIADSNHDFTQKAKEIKQFGPFKLFEVPTSGWFDVVNSPMFVQSDKTNFINIVNLWHRSYPRRWNMYPLISVEKKPAIPQGLERVIKMKDEVTYNVILNSFQDPNKIPKQVRDDNKSLNIFSDFPFVFPEATVSGRIKREKIEKQTYSATVEVPDNCKSCMVMFKMSYHPDWQVKVDGQSTEKYAVFPFYLAAQVTPGEHTVEFTYQPNRLKTILLVMEVILLILLVFRNKIFQYK
ncbi:YfhO family protein, partial [Candidatus Microgenomates bacterium]|nr:YfhO family protein [Candidatus Microgenomates bacterium]